MLFRNLLNYSSKPMYFPLLIVFIIFLLKSLYTLTGFAIFFEMVTSLSILMFATQSICRFTFCLSCLFLILKLRRVQSSSYLTSKLYKYINGKKVIESNNGSKKLFTLSIVKSWECCSTVLYRENRKTKIPKPVKKYLNIFSTCLCSGLNEAAACIIAENTITGTIINSFVKLNVKKFTMNSIYIVHLIVSKNTFLKYALSFTLLIFSNEIKPKPKVQISVSLSNEISQSPNL